MQHCEGCGKLIEGRRGALRCRTCLEVDREAVTNQQPEQTSPPEKDKATPQVLEEVEVPVRDEPCVRCRKHKAMIDSDFCLACQLELLSLLGDAAHELFQVPAPPPKPPISSAVSLMNDIEDKRERTATSRIRVVGGVKIK